MLDLMMTEIGRGSRKSIGQSSSVILNVLFLDVLAVKVPDAEVLTVFGDVEPAYSISINEERKKCTRREKTSEISNVKTNG